MSAPKQKECPTCGEFYTGEYTPGHCWNCDPNVPYNPVTCRDCGTVTINPEIEVCPECDEELED
jgi:RNA polymerase subunit RPABC4/transcription elongation factor Spt4